jgi:hypothetical protein
MLRYIKVSLHRTPPPSPVKREQLIFLTCYSAPGASGEMTLGSSIMVVRRAL